MNAHQLKKKSTTQALDVDSRGDCTCVGVGVGDISHILPSPEALCN